MHTHTYICITIYIYICACVCILSPYSFKGCLGPSKITYEPFKVLGPAIKNSGYDIEDLEFYCPTF